MVLKKGLGLIISIVGIAGMALSYEEVAQVLNLTLPKMLSANVLFYSSIILVVLGILLLLNRSGGGNKLKEVPIYHGKDVVGYRRQ